jgi:hypothetical protein
MSSATLSSELVAKIGGGFTDSNAAIEGWAEAWTKYFEAAQAGVVPVVVSALRTTTAPATNNPKAAMKTAMAGLNSPGGADGALQSAIQAFWTQLATDPAVYFTGATQITAPSGLSGIGADLLKVFPVNQSEAVTSTVGLDRIAKGHGPVSSVGLHSLNLGGTAKIASVDQPIT